MKKVKELLKALNEINVLNEQAVKELQDQLLDQTKSHSEAEKEIWKEALRILKKAEERRRDAIKALSRI
jgi:hypothetical protein